MMVVGEIGGVRFKEEKRWHVLVRDGKSKIKIMVGFVLNQIKK